MSTLARPTIRSLVAPEQRLRRNSLGVLLLLAIMPSNGLGLDLCPFHLLSDVICPLCGLCRSISSLLHGEISTSLHYHPLGIPSAALLGYLVMSNRFPLTRMATERQLAAAAGIAAGAVWAVRLLVAGGGL
jgi:hypothetical protein